MLYKFNILFLLSCLNNKIMSINSLSSSSTVQHTINNLSTYVYINTLNSFLLHLQFQSIHILTKSLPQDSPKSHNPVKCALLCKLCQLCCQFLPIMLALCIRSMFCFPRLCWHNRRLKPTYAHPLVKALFSVSCMCVYQCLLYSLSINVSNQTNDIVK